MSRGVGAGCEIVVCWSADLEAAIRGVIEGRRDAPWEATAASVSQGPGMLGDAWNRSIRSSARSHPVSWGRPSKRPSAIGSRFVGHRKSLKGSCGPYC